MRIAALTLISASFLLAQAPDSAEKTIPEVPTFVAPAFPRAAKDKRIMGKTVTRIEVNRDGVVTEVKTISANPVFEGHVVDALKKWRFKPSDREHTLQVICSFEFDDECEGTDKHPITSETHVSAELPTVVHIKTGLQCLERSVGQQRRQ
jgi:TonB family protein